MPAMICQGCGTEHAAWTGQCPKCGNTAILKIEPVSDKMIGRQVKGGWKIVRKLGQGGMGAVYLAEKEGLGQRVALKFLNANLLTDTEIARRFLNEAKTYARINHPNAVTLHDFQQEEDGSLFIAMEFVEGADLKKLLGERKRLPVPDAVEIALQVADVLNHAHQKGVIHRDLKPENVMVRTGMRGIHVKVLDFGIARLVEEGVSRLTAQGSIAGTPRYMSPEQVEGQEVDARADIYALGVVLFEMVSGVQPFDGATIAEILRNQVVRPMPWLREVSPELDLPSLDSVIQRACAKNRVERYPTMAALAQDLSNAMPTFAAHQVPSGLHPVPTPPPVAGPELPTDVDPFGGANTFRPNSLPPPVASSPRLEAPDLPSAVAPAKSRAPVLVGGALALLGLGAAGAMLLRPAPHEGSPPVKVAAAPSRELPPPPVRPPPVAPVAVALPVQPTAVGVGADSAAVPAGHLDAAAPPSPAPDNPQPSLEPVRSPPRTTSRSTSASHDKAPGVRLAAAGPSQPPPAAAGHVSNETQRLSLEMFLKADAAFIEGRLEVAGQLLQTVPPDPSVNQRVEELGVRVADAKARLGRGRALAKNGDCRGALSLFDKLLKDYPGLDSARRERDACKAMLPPDLAE